MTVKRIRFESQRKRESWLSISARTKHNEVHRRTRRSKTVRSAANLSIYLNHFKNEGHRYPGKKFASTNSLNPVQRSSLDCKETLTRADPTSLPDCETTKSFALDSELDSKLDSKLERQFVHFKIMTILIVLSVGVLFGSVLASFSSDRDPRSLDANRLNKVNSFISEKYSASNQSSLFYDLSLTSGDEPNDQQAKKPIYFHFISNKPSEAIGSKAIHSSPNNKIKNGHKQFDRSKPSLSLHQAYLQRFMLNNDTVKCNDGTEAGYYFRKGKNAKKWIVFLEGGWFCYSTFSCNHQRWLQMRNLMTSAHLPEKKLGKVKKTVSIIQFF